MANTVTRAVAVRSAKLIPLERRVIQRIERSRLPEYLEREEIHRMADLADNARDRLLILTLYATGGRITEVLSIQRRHFDREERTIRMVNLKQHRNPNDPPPEKVVYLSQNFAYDLLGYCESQAKRGEDYLFTAKNTGRSLSRVAGWKIVHHLAERAGVKKPGHLSASPKLARHGAAIRMLRDGVPTKMVQDQLGHASILTTTGFYNQFSAADKREFMSRVSF